MKKALAAMAVLLALIIPFSAALSADIVQPTDEYVSDYAEILSPSVESNINMASQALEQQGKGAQIVVVTVPDLDGMTIEKYANLLIRDWGVGSAAEDNGIVILLSMDPREIRIEVGRGLEGRLTDSKVGRILDNYTIPFLKDDNFDQGITGAYQALFNEVCQEYGLDPEVVSSGVIEKQEEESRTGFVSMIVAFVMVVVVASYFRGRRGGRGGPGNRSGGELWPLIMYGMGHHRGRSRGVGSYRGGGGGGGFRGGGGSGRGGGASRGF